VRILKKKKLKLKKEVWKLGIILLFLVLAIYIGKNVYNDIQYKKTNEYKLLEIGYTKEDIKLLNESTNDDIINSLINTDKNEFLLSLIKEKYYLKKNLNRYLTYETKHKNYPPAKIIAMVNTYNDYDFYEHDIDTDISKDCLLLTNKFYNLKKDYIPSDLVNISNKYYYGSDHKTRKVVYDNFINMWNAAYEENIYLIVNSSYRTYESQKSVYDSYKDSRGTEYADSIAARAGYSEHQTGLALDIFSKENTLISNFKGSTAHNWLLKNAHKYGFIERFPEDKEDITGFAPETWHYRYVGIDAATYIHDNNITFDEYYAYFIEK